MAQGYNILAAEKVEGILATTTAAEGTPESQEQGTHTRVARPE